ncbi:hypothetical protein FA13DRAFT_1730463 [Coprinellus micaceus]|uniref:Uncharacterized protein n=1 Tax=Coprinellus micaceus TaxID=71717 RepID=A0A4Y7TGZ2_COPMI|nr:hypothetical protein FA13DRAFT_1730463 [Coprinellus micaceus]
MGQKLLNLTLLNRGVSSAYTSQPTLVSAAFGNLQVASTVCLRGGLPWRASTTGVFLGFPPLFLLNIHSMRRKKTDTWVNHTGRSAIACIRVAKSIALPPSSIPTWHYGYRPLTRMAFHRSNLDATTP